MSSMSRFMASVGFSPSRWKGARKMPNVMPLWVMVSEFTGWRRVLPAAGVRARSGGLRVSAGAQRGLDGDGDAVAERLPHERLVDAGIGPERPDQPGGLGVAGRDQQRHARAA